MTNQELNEAVARKLGWTSFDKGMGGLPEDRGTWEGALIATPLGKSDTREKVPNYCTSIESAFKIIDFITSNNKAVMLRKYHQLDYWYFSINWECCDDPLDGELEIVKYAETAAKAICLAFLELPTNGRSHEQ